MIEVVELGQVEGAVEVPVQRLQVRRVQVRRRHGLVLVQHQEIVCNRRANGRLGSTKERVRKTDSQTHEDFDETTKIHPKGFFLQT